MHIKKAMLLVVMGMGSCGFVGAMEVPKVDQGAPKVAAVIAAVPEKKLEAATTFVASLSPKEVEAVRALIGSQLSAIQPKDLEVALQELRGEVYEKMHEKVEFKRGYFGVQFAAILVATGILAWLLSATASSAVSTLEAFARFQKERDLERKLHENERSA